MLGLKILELATISLLSVATSTTKPQDVGYYPLTTVVSEVNDEMVVVEDFNGNEWAFENVGEDWFVGDIASLMMCDNGTEIIYDDSVVDAVYNGWFEGWKK